MTLRRAAKIRLAVFTVTMAVFYACFSFIALEANALNWDAETRVFFTIIAPFFSFFLAGFPHIEDYFA